MFPCHILRASHKRCRLRHNVWTNALQLMFMGRGVGEGEVDSWHDRVEEDSPLLPSVDVTIGARPFAEKALDRAMLQLAHLVPPRSNFSARRRTPGTSQAAWREMVATSGFRGVCCILLIGCPPLPAAQDSSKLEFRESHRPHHRRSDATLASDSSVPVVSLKCLSRR